MREPCWHRHVAGLSSQFRGQEVLNTAQTACCLHGCARPNHELKDDMAVAAVSSWVSEGVLNNIVDEDRMLRNYPGCWKSLLSDACFVENVSPFT